ncbi:hypothetical protein GCM10010446_23930 [Streptomyces enissocaesilis]|uniref:Uncharacterized protein n=1 Tax=Streptomyces enissocaesilis TaxID=332589 RepID=A0ABP6JM43_9ACTN
MARRRPGRTVARARPGAQGDPGFRPAVDRRPGGTSRRGSREERADRRGCGGTPGLLGTVANPVSLFSGWGGTSSGREVEYRTGTHRSPSCRGAAGSQKA